MQDDDNLYAGVYYNEDCTMVCINISSEIPITSQEFFAYLNWFIHEHAHKKIHDIGDEIAMEFEEEDPMFNN